VELQDAGNCHGSGFTAATHWPALADSLVESCCVAMSSTGSPQGARTLLLPCVGEGEKAPALAGTLAARTEALFPRVDHPGVAAAAEAGFFPVDAWHAAWRDAVGVAKADFKKHAQDGLKKVAAGYKPSGGWTTLTVEGLRAVAQTLDGDGKLPWVAGTDADGGVRTGPPPGTPYATGPDSTPVSKRQRREGGGGGGGGDAAAEEDALAEGIMAGAMTVGVAAPPETGGGSSGAAVGGGEGAPPLADAGGRVAPPAGTEAPQAPAGAGSGAGGSAGEDDTVSGRRWA